MSNRSYKVNAIPQAIKPELPLDRTEGIYRWGRDNKLPTQLENLFESSVTAKNCIDKSAKTIIGRGLTNGDLIVNKGGQTLNDLVRAMAREYVKHNNVFLWIKFDGNGDVASVEVAPCKHTRIGQRDDNGYAATYVYYDNWDKSQTTEMGYNPSGDGIELYAYSPYKEDTVKRIKSAGEGDINKGTKRYKGEILHIKKHNDLYSESDGYCVINQMVAEINAGVFLSKGTLDGFVQSTLLTTQPIDDERARAEFLEGLQDSQGVAGANKIIHLEAAEAGGELENQFNIQPLSTAHNDKLFEYTEGSTEKAISKAFNVPLALINPSEHGAFNGSGEMYKTIKAIMFEEREEERMKIEETLRKVFKRWNRPERITEVIKIIDMNEITPESQSPGENNENSNRGLHNNI